MVPSLLLLIMCYCYEIQRNSMKNRFLIVSLFFGCFIDAQNIKWRLNDGSLTVGNEIESFESNTIQYLNLSQLLSFQKAAWGLIGDIYESGSIKVEVFVYDPQFPNGDAEGNRPLLCSITQRSSSSEYNHDATQIYNKHEEENKSYFAHYFRLIFGSNSGYSDTNYGAILKDWESNDIRVGAIRAGLLDVYQGVVAEESIPVIIKATIVNATFKKLKLPGKSDQMIPAKIFGQFHKMDLNVASFIGNMGFEGYEVLDKLSGIIENVNGEIIISSGNWNNYRPNSNNDYDTFVGSYFHSYLSPYIGLHGEGSTDVNRFFPICGEYDYKDDNGDKIDDLEGETKWRTFFNKNQQEAQYYDFMWGQVHFFALNTNNRDGDSSTPIADENSAMAQWLKVKLEDSSDTSKFKVVLMHHPPYASNVGDDNGFSILRWPFKEWGANIVISGHAGFYERHEVDGFTYIVNGLGGAGKSVVNESNFSSTLVTGTHYDDYGVLNMMGIGWPERNSYNFQFRNTEDEMLDQFWLFSDQATWYYNRDLPKLAKGSNEAIDLFLLIGQSNMRSICEEANTGQGRCFFDPEDPNTLTNTYLLNDSNTFELATNPINQYATCDRKPPTYGAVNVGWTFGPKVCGNTGVKVGLISNAVGDTFIRQWQKDYDIRGDNGGKEYENWQKDWMHVEYKGGNPYTEAMNRVKNALLAYPNAKLKAILWIQGENDAASGSPPKHETATPDDVYTSYLNQMVLDFRTDLRNFTGDDTYISLPFLIGEIRHDEDFKNPHPWSFDHYNQLFNEIADADPYKFVVSSKGFTILKWGVHFDLPSNKVYGERFADVYLGAIPYISPESKIANVKSEEISNVITLKNNSNLEIHPNPSEGLFTIDFPPIFFEKEGNIQVIDLSGNVLSSEKIVAKEAQTEIDLGKYASGVYILKLRFVDKVQTTLLLKK